MDSRARIVAEAMRLFGEQGYTKTTIAEIERAAGLSPGSGALYRHFRSKEELLAEGVRSKIAENAGLLATLSDTAGAAALTPRQRLALLARAGLRRLGQERDLNRIVVRDLAAFPALLQDVREGEMHRIHSAVAQWLRTQSDAQDRDWDALAVALVGSLSHFWLLQDVFGTHPSGLDEDRFVDAFVDLAEQLVYRSGS
ncbi:TetR/AcrR family transcriptional regulator [Peterkaempfera sp. SMS 1(5)a]|uniref:TetR/AcrR family transcriptional regulator n=1 Tax=Peterkaempfera podocarpi TaxID=3232308 RepID=UPI00366B5E83